MEMENCKQIQIDRTERRKRNKMLRILSEKKLRNFYVQHEGTDRPVLFEHENRDGQMFGYTDNYIKVKFPYDENLANKIKEVNLSRIESDGIVGVELLPVLK